MAKQEITCDDILKELRAKQYRPVYYLMGEEPYYIDLIADYITDNILTETEKEFNLTVVYGADVDIATVINAAKRYPMMSEHQVVVVKEAQNIRNMEELSYYLQKPLLSTILVICHKHGVLDRRKKLAAEIENDPKRFLRFPTKYEIHEYRIMEDFIEQLSPGKVQSNLSYSIRGKGAFRRFKESIRYHGLEQQWYDCLEKAYRDIAVRWCTEEGLAYSG